MGIPAHYEEGTVLFPSFSVIFRAIYTVFANVSKPLNAKTSEKVTFVWTKEMKKSFDTSKLKLITAPVLAYLDYQKAFLVRTDA